MVQGSLLAPLVVYRVMFNCTPRGGGGGGVYCFHVVGPSNRDALITRIRPVLIKDMTILVSYVNKRTFI